MKTMTKSELEELQSKIKHRPLFNTKSIEEHYSKKDGVPVRYVCTSSLDPYSTYCYDIFYRKDAHPEFGNCYFGLYLDSYDRYMITNADRVEQLKFDMLFVNDEYHYSRHRHDFNSVGECSIDGGRAYTRRVGDLSVPLVTFRLRNGNFCIED
jgi:hypothetical protein